MSQNNNQNNNCNSKIFDSINKYAQGQDEEFKNEVNEVNQLYNNGKFYYSTGENVGALVSYSCAAVLLNSILRKVKGVSINIGVTTVTPSASGNTTPVRSRSQSVEQPGQNIEKDITNLMASLLQVIQSLQQQVGTKSAGGEKEEMKDWEKICTKIKPLVFKTGSPDCIFYDDVAGLRKEKDIIDSSLVKPLLYPNLYPKTAKGILIYGPPGTGKTYLAKAAVNELQLKDPSVGVIFFAPSPGDLKGKYVGETEKRIEEIFHCAKDAACECERSSTNKKYISVIFMDEMDAIAPDRDKDTTGLAVNSVNTLLQMMDGIKSYPNVVVVAATNYPWNLDGAILRRFDTQLFINIPNENELKELFNMEMNKAINLDKDRSLFKFCENDPDKANPSADAIGKQSKSDNSCNSECKPSELIERYRTAPYSSFVIDYFANNKSGGLIDSIVSELYREKFSNSDLNRLIKVATTHAGSLAVKSSLFYSTTMVNDYRSTFKEENDRYISCLSGFNNKTKDGKIDFDAKVKQSITILDQFVKGSVINNIVQLSPPDIIRIQCGDYWYYNSKCILFKNTTVVIDHPLIKDVYIKVHPVNVSDFTKVDTDMYLKNVLGVSDVGKLQNKTYAFDNVDIIVGFDFSFKQSNNSITGMDLLLPVNRSLINNLFKPLYKEFETIKNNIEAAEKVEGIKGVKGSPQQAENIYIAQLKSNQNYSDDNINDFKDNNFLNIDNKNVISLSNTTEIMTVKDTVRASLTANCIQYFMSIEQHNFDFYNFLLLIKIAGDNILQFTNQELNNIYQENNSAYKTNFTNNIDLYLKSFTKYDTFVKIFEDKDYSFENTPTISYNTIYDLCNVYLIKDNNGQENILITLESYKKMIKNITIYDECFKYTVNENVKFIQIEKQLFEILFKDVLIDTKLDNIPFDEISDKYGYNPELKQQLLQLNLNEIFINSKLSTKLVNNTGLDSAKIAMIESYNNVDMYGYIAKLFFYETISDYFNFSVKLLYDNYLFNTKQVPYFLGNEIKGHDKLLLKLIGGGPDDDAKGPDNNEDNEDDAEFLDVKNAQSIVDEKINTISKILVNSFTNEPLLQQKTLMKTPKIEKELVHGKNAMEALANNPDLMKDAPTGAFGGDRNDDSDSSDESDNDSDSDSDNDVEDIPNIGGSIKKLFYKKNHTKKIRRKKNDSKSKLKSKKSQSFRNKLDNKNKKTKKRHVNRANNNYIGGAGDAENKFIEWCTGNYIDTNNVGEKSEIAKKTLFIQTSINYKSLMASARNNVWDIGYSGIKGVYNLFSGGNKNTEEQNFNEKIQELNKSNTLLAESFNKINWIGTMADPLVKNVQDDGIIKTPKITWCSLAEVYSTYTDFFTSIKGILLGRLRTTMGYGFDTVSAVVAGVAALGLMQGIDSLMYSNKNIGEDVIFNEVSKQLFNLLINMNYLDYKQSDKITSANDIILDYLKKQTKAVGYLYGKYKIEDNESIKYTDLCKPTNQGDIIKNNSKPLIITGDIKNKLVNLNTPMQSFYYAMTIVKSTYNKETGPLLQQYYENRDLFMENYKKRESKRK